MEEPKNKHSVPNIWKGNYTKHMEVKSNETFGGEIILSLWRRKHIKHTEVNYMYGVNHCHPWLICLAIFLVFVAMVAFAAQFWPHFLKLWHSISLHPDQFREGLSYLKWSKLVELSTYSFVLIQLRELGYSAANLS